MKYEFRSEVCDTASGKVFTRGQVVESKEIPTAILEILKRERTIVEVKDAKKPE